MNKLRIVAVFVTIIALTVFSGAAKKPGGGATEEAVFGPAPDGKEDVSSSENAVTVGTDVWTYSPYPIELYLSGELVSGTQIAGGTHWGKARCLKKNGPEGGRLDYYFDCTGDELNTCANRLIVRYGIYDRLEDDVILDPGSMLLVENRPDGSVLKEGMASFSIDFPK